MRMDFDFNKLYDLTIITNTNSYYSYKIKGEKIPKLFSFIDNISNVSKKCFMDMCEYVEIDCNIYIDFVDIYLIEKILIKEEGSEGWSERWSYIK